VSPMGEVWVGVGLGCVSYREGGLCLLWRGVGCVPYEGGEGWVGWGGVGVGVGLCLL